MKPEMKYMDNTSVTGAVGSGPGNWSLWYVPAITRGVENYSRIGNAVTLKRIDIMVKVYRNAGGAAVQRVHLGLIKTPSPFGVSAQAGDVYDNPSAFYPFRYEEYFNEFKLLFSRDIVLDANKPATDVVVSIPLGFTTRFTGNAGTAADCLENCLDLVAWSDQAATQPGVEGGFRIYWTDF